MRQIPYNNAAAALRFAFPSDWDAQNITSVTLTVKDTAGNELLAADACTLWDGGDATQINGAVEVDDNSLIIELTGAGTLPVPVPGDVLQIAASAAGPKEDIKVLFYAVATKTITAEVDFRYGHSDNAGIVGLYCTYDLDTSTVADWPLSKPLVLTWTAVGTDDLPCRERGEVVNSEFSIPGFADEFSVVYPREYEAAVDPINRLPQLLQHAHNQVRAELAVKGLFIDRVVDSTALIPVLMAKVRWIVLLSGDDQYETEREVASKEYDRQLTLLATSPMWADDNQDGIKTESEFEDHSQYFLERSL